MLQTLKIFAAALLMVLGSLASARPAAADTPGWPRVKTIDGNTVTFYEPQADAWDNYKKLSGQMAASVLKPGEKSPAYGVVRISANTVVDYDKRAVQLTQVQVTSISFPLLSADENKRLDDYIRAQSVNDSVMPLDTVLLNMQRSKLNLRETKIDTNPPLIYYSSKPAILIIFDGDPIMSPIKDLGADLRFAVNTNWNVFETGKTYYLLAGSFWLQAAAATGPWKPVGALPAVFNKLPADDNWKDARANLNAKPIAASDMPTLWVSTKQAEAIVVGGAPALKPISGTQLSYVENTDATLFKSGATWYYLSSGRWFRANSLSGPWTFAGNDLPKDFAKIPADGPRGFVLPSVPGTPQAENAIIESQVPREATIDRNKASLSVTYAGDPKFVPVNATKLSYAVNTSTHVIMLGDPLYYACENGVWFTATSPNGPWKVADTVPPEIYNIPPDSPLYQDTFVTVESSTAVSVTFAFTAGYLWGYPWRYGYYYGPGWWYRPWWGWYGGYPIYYPWPRTYVGGVYYNPWTGAYARGVGVYGPYGGARVAAGVTAGGAYWRGGAVYGPYGGIGRVSFYNPATGNYYHGVAAWGPNGIAYRGTGGNRYGQVPTPYQSWGNAAKTPSVSAPSTLPAGGGVAAARPAGGTNAAKPGTLPAGGTNAKPGTQPAGGANAKPGTRPVGGTNANKPATPSVGTGNVFAGKDGNVYQPTANGGWSQYNNKTGSWQPTNAPGATTTAANAPANRPQTANAQPGMNAGTYQGLQQSNTARVQGAQNFGGARSGGARGGGGRGR